MGRQKSTNKQIENSEQAIQQATDEALHGEGLTVSPFSFNNNTELDFEAVYLRQATNEFADDLEKLRKASDFKPDRSVSILIEALKQGAACYSKDEKLEILAAQDK